MRAGAFLVVPIRLLAALRDLVLPPRRVPVAVRVTARRRVRSR